MKERSLALEGRLVATADIPDGYRYDRDHIDHVFLLRRPVGYELLVVGRSETYAETGELRHAAVRVSATATSSVSDLRELVETRWPGSSGAWWALLDTGRHEDADLHAAWVPVRMRHDLDESSVHDRSLATTTGYFNGRDLGAPGRQAAEWKEQALAAMAEHLDHLGWTVTPGPHLSPDVAPGGLLSTGTEIVGCLWARRYGTDAPVIVRVDDCGEIYPRLADADDLLDPSVHPRLASPRPAEATHVSTSPSTEPIPIDHAIAEIIDHLGGAAPGFGLQL